MLEYIKEATNNYNIAIANLNKFGIVNLGCIYCKEIYCIEKNINKFISNYNNTIVCNCCNVDAVIPIVPESKLFDNIITYEGQIKKIQEFHIDGFTPIIDEDEYYEDYEYNENIEENENIEKMKIV